MRRLLVSWGLLFVVALLILKWPRGGDELERNLKPTKSRSALSVRKVALAQSEEGNRLDGLEPRFHALVERLEEDCTQWQREFGPYHNSQIGKYEWEKFALRRVSKCSVEEIVGLLAWIGEGRLSFFDNILRYRTALFWNWGKVDAMAALHFLKGYSESDDGRDSVFSTSFASFTGFWSNPVFEGWAENDAAAAWEFYSEICEDPEANWPSNWSATDGVLRELTAENAEAAWKLIVSETRTEIQSMMLKGYIAGLSENQDWAEVGRKIGTISEDESLREELAQRWFLEEPDEALGWYQTNFSYKIDCSDSNSFGEPHAILSKEEVLAEFGIIEGELWLDVKIAFLEKIAVSQGRRGQEAFTSWAEENLAKVDTGGAPLIMALIFANESDDSDPFASEESIGGNIFDSVDSSSEWHLSAQGIDFLPLVACLPPEIARQLVMRVLNAMPEVQEDPDLFGLVDGTFENAKVAREVVRELVEKVPLSSEERAQAETVFVRLDEQERVLLEGCRKASEGSK